jgi:mgtE-like transporter
VQRRTHVTHAVRPGVRAAARHEFREILAAELLSVTGGAIAGVLLALAKDELLLVPGIFLLLPGFLEMRGNIAGTMAARLANALHIHEFSTATRHPRLVRDNYIASTLLALVVATALGLTAFLITRWLFGAASPKIILIAPLAALISNIIMLPATWLATAWIFRHHLDPNNIMGPYVTTVGDIVSTVSLIAAIAIV